MNEYKDKKIMEEEFFSGESGSENTAGESSVNEGEFTGNENTAESENAAVKEEFAEDVNAVEGENTAEDEKSVETAENEKSAEGETSTEKESSADDHKQAELTPEELEKKQQEERDRQIQELEDRKNRRRKKKRRKKLLLVGFLVCALVGAEAAGGYYVYNLMNNYKQENIKLQESIKLLEEELKAYKPQETTEEKTTEKKTEETAETTAKVDESETIKKYLKKAAKYAAQYDYNRAIKTLKKYENYDSSEELQKKVQEYEEIKASCISWPAEEVTHVFYHTLIKDVSKSFDGDYKEGDYNQVMTTIDEFNKITQIMYEKGYVMVSIYDLAVVNEDGTMGPGEILLPPGKIPFILSQDDVSYYHYMDGDGYATKLIVDEDGKVRNEYLEDDGSISVGDYDMVPLIDRFVEEHPDFSYKGAKGIIALTGYNGILGYRTDISYETRPDDLDDVKKKWLEANPDFDLEKERENAAHVAEVMRENGWLFASHTWGHLNVQEASLERLQADTQRFKENVDPLIGGTDIIIFAFGTDLAQVEDYSGEKFDYYKSQGYNYYCNVDSSKYFVQLRDNYFRMGRRNLDGYRMYYNPEMLEDLFDAAEVFDKARPVPVPEMG